MPKYSVKYEFDLFKVLKNGAVREKAGKGESFVETDITPDAMIGDPLLDASLRSEVEDSNKLKRYTISGIKNINISPYEEKEPRNFRKRISKS